VLGGRAEYLPTSLDHAVCIRNDGQERYFLPRVLAIRGEDGLLGAAIVLQDVTRFRLVDQLKSGRPPAAGGGCWTADAQADGVAAGGAS
jgi:hypothetical protein